MIRQAHDSNTDGDVQAPQADTGDAAWTLLIDIDGTLIRQPEPEPTDRWPHRLLGLAATMAEANGHPRPMVETIIDAVLERVWWRWNDFVEALGLDAATFWPIADQTEAKLTEVIDPGLHERLRRLRDAGFRLCVVSNNPDDGIAHKLRLAGIAGPEQARLFSHTFATNTVAGNKADAAFWSRVIHNLGGPEQRFISIGNHRDEDERFPAAAGVDHWLPVGDVSPDVDAFVWDEVEAMLLEMQSTGASLPVTVSS